MPPTNHWSRRQLPRLITWLRWLFVPKVSDRRMSARSGRPKPSRRRAWYQASRTVDSVWPASHAIIAVVTVSAPAIPRTPLATTPLTGASSRTPLENEKRYSASSSAWK